MQKLKQAILKTQKNPKITVDEDTPYGNFTSSESHVLSTCYVVLLKKKVVKIQQQVAVLISHA